MEVQTVIREPKKAYSFDTKTGEFLGVVYADPDQLNSKHWICPRNATFDEMDLELAENEVAVRQLGSWKAVSDFRGKEYWGEDGTQYTITDLGEDVPEGVLLAAPKILPTVEEQTALANAECTKRINAHWDQIGQINASLGIYGDEDTAACTAWIASNRKALVSLLAREGLVDIDVTDNQYWPVFE